MKSEKIVGGIPQPETPKNFEDFLAQEIPRQHEACVTSLRNTGLLEEIVLDHNELALEMKEGITGLDGKKYELPSVEKIAKHFSAEKYKEKFEQGFTKLLIIPFGYPLVTLRIRYAEQLLKHSRAGKLLDRNNQPLELDEKKPFYFSDALDHSDETGGMIYYPKQFDEENHGGKTKQELLNDKTQPFPGFHVLLIKPDLTISRVGKGKTMGNREDLETGKSSIAYLKLLTEPQYREEKGFTIEDSIVLAMTHLEQTDQVIDDFGNNQDSFNFNVGNYHLASGVVPRSYWYRSNRRANVSESAPKDGYDIGGARVAVG